MKWIKFIIAKYFHRYKLINIDLVRDENGRVDKSKHGEPGQERIYKCKKCGLNKRIRYYPYSDIVETKIWQD